MNLANSNDRARGRLQRDDSMNTSQSMYFDALGPEGAELDHETPDGLLQDQLAHLASDGAVNSTFLYGAKPVWGWDYVLSFKIKDALFTANIDSPTQDDSSGNRGRRSDSVKDLRDSEYAYGDADVESDEINVGDEREQAKRKKFEELTRARVEILARLKSAGFVFSQLFIPSEGVILVRVSLSEKRMKEKAMELGMELQLKEEYGGGYLAFSFERQEAFVNHDQQRERNSYFCPADRAMIVVNVLQSKEDWGCGLNIELLLYEKTLVQAFAIHSELERRTLIADTVWKRIWDPTYLPPFNALKDYLGARVSFYFVFVSFYARRLLLIALLSVPIYTIYRVLRNATVIAILRWVFSIGIVLWTTVFLENWKRRNASINIEWGLDDYKEDTADDTRVQYTGDIRLGFYCNGGFVSLADLVEEMPEEGQNPLGSVEEGRKPVDRNLLVPNIPKQPYHDPKEARKMRIQSFFVTTFFAILVGSLTFLLLWFRSEIIDFFAGETDNPGSFPKAMPGILNGILITVFDSIWSCVSLILTQRENHRTNQEFENSLIFKRFAFQFVSNYISLYYIAFVMPRLSNNTCRQGFLRDGPDCMVELEFQMMSLVITKATIGQITEIGIPFVTSRVKLWLSRRRSANIEELARGTQTGFSSSHNRYVKEAHLGSYTTTMEDYGELVVQFGYLVLFGLAFPPAAVVALVNNLIEGRTDAFKILSLCQRVNADDAADIGAWYEILEILNVLSVLTNAGLVVFTAKAAQVIFGFDDTADGWRLLLYNTVAFFVMEHVLLAVKLAAAVLIPDVPGRTKRKKARQSYDIARFFGVGWQNAYRGNAMLEVDERQVELCQKYADLFDVASEDEG